MTRAEVSEKIARMKAVQRGLVKAVGSDYNDQRRFQVREIEVNGKVVSRLMKIDTNLKYLPSEDLFNEIYDLHVGKGHCGRDLLNKKIKEKFANVTIENISSFLKTCQFCTTKRKSSEKKGTVVKPILSKDAFSRFQVDYIDLQSCPDVTEDGTFRFVLHGQDHLTKFSFLKATPNKTALTTVKAIKSWFDLIGPPAILHTDNGREFCNQVFLNSVIFCHNIIFELIFMIKCTGAVRVPGKAWSEDDQWSSSPQPEPGLC